jgi:hypothetical protein
MMSIISQIQKEKCHILSSMEAKKVIIKDEIKIEAEQLEK